MTSRPVIDIETLEVWPSVKACARAIGVSYPRIHQAIMFNGRVGNGKRNAPGGHLIEYLDYWIEAYTPAEKERHTRQNNIFFL